MRIDHNSYGTIAFVCILCFVLMYICVKYIKNPYLGWGLSAVLFGFCIFITMFFRVPVREPAGNEKLVTAGADGKVVIAEKVFEKEYLKCECWQVSIYMDFFDVHVNYYPVSGEVEYYKYHPGKYLLAFLPKSSELNEHSSTVIRTPDGKKVLFKQIAGTFARRIVCYSKVGDQVEAGKQCGIIKFGSRFDIFLPLDADLKVQIGDFTTAAETIVAHL